MRMYVSCAQVPVRGFDQACENCQYIHNPKINEVYVGTD